MEETHLRHSDDTNEHTEPTDDLWDGGDVSGK